jgi:hypothetical protein
MLYEVTILPDDRMDIVRLVHVGDDFTKGLDFMQRDELLEWLARGMLQRSGWVGVAWQLKVGTTTANRTHVCAYDAYDAPVSAAQFLTMQQTHTRN